MSPWPFLLKHLSYSPVNPFDSFHTWRESTDPTFSNSLDYYTISHIAFSIIHKRKFLLPTGVSWLLRLPATVDQF
jgi:hypothetical protein